jgi:thioredoxin-related protein
MKIRIVLLGVALMIASAFTRGRNGPADCLPCGPPILPYPQRVLPQNASGADLIYVVGVYDPARDPSSDLVTAIERASAEQKRILVEVGGEWCVWCHILDDFVQSEKEILSALGESYVILKVNFDNVNRNEAFLSKYPAISGYPHIHVLESDGSFLHSQQTDELETGRSYSRSAILGFLRKWAAEQR